MSKPKKGKAKPMTPTEIARQRAAEREAAKRPENWGIDRATLKAQADVKVTMTPDRKQAQTARRDDVFDRLLARGGLSQSAHQAIRRLDADMTERRGEGERGQGEKVDGGGARDLVTQRMIDAGDRVDGALLLVGRRDAALLRELLEPRRVITMGLDRWRMVVRMLTGETHVHAQGASLRSACDNLAAAYQEIDRTPRARAA